jgi:hypothetical protein
MASTQHPRIVISEATTALARMIKGGGTFSFELVTKVLDVHRDTLNASLKTLELFGAISFTNPRRGRPPKESAGHEFAVEVNPQSWVWAAIAQSEVKP